MVGDGVNAFPWYDMKSIRPLGTEKQLHEDSSYHQLRIFRSATEAETRICQRGLIVNERLDPSPSELMEIYRGAPVWPR